jgi:predicted ATP-dependent serine protease
VYPYVGTCMDCGEERHLFYGQCLDCKKEEESEEDK